MNSILVVEDDNLIGNAVEQWLNQENSVHWVKTVATAQMVLNAQEFDIVILDLGLPDGHGFELLRKLKRDRHNTGVLIMSAYGEIDHRVDGLDLGADDYLVKPIDFKELDARIRSIKRRKDGLNNHIIDHGAISLDVSGKSVTLSGSTIHLSAKEMSILVILMQGRGRYFSKLMLEERLYDHNSTFEGNAIEVHISALRKKLGRELIKTTRGLGYIINRIPAS